MELVLHLGVVQAAWMVGQLQLPVRWLHSTLQQQHHQPCFVLVLMWCRASSQER
jgi:hypothetical protein